MKMRYYIIRRFVLLAFVLFGLITFTFFISHILPGDPARLHAGHHATREAMEAITRRWGLDKPLWQQYVIYLKSLLRGDMGDSLRSRRPVTSDLMDYFPATFELTTVSIIITMLVGIPLGVISATKKDTILDHISRIISTTGVATPTFWLGLLLQLSFYRHLGWFPFGGRLPPGMTPPKQITGLYILDSLLTGNLNTLVASVWHITMPAICLSYVSLATVTRMLRATMLEVMDQDYIKTTRAMGLRERMVVYKYALKNALIPVITVVGLSYGGMLGGTLLIESVFAWPGLGYYATQGILTLDFPAIIGTTFLFGFIYIIVNLLTDILYAFFDPRITYE